MNLEAKQHNLIIYIFCSTFYIIEIEVLLLRNYGLLIVLGILIISSITYVFDLQVNKKEPLNQKLPEQDIVKKDIVIREELDRIDFIVADNVVQPVSEPIRISFVGDIMMDGSIKSTLKTKGSLYPYTHIKEEIQQSDLAIANLETAVTTSTNAFPKKYNFKADSDALSGLKEAGFDLVSLANNHTMDFGQAGLIETVASLRAYNIAFIGAGKNAEEAYRSHEVIIKGKIIKTLAFSRVLPDVAWKVQQDVPGIADGYNLDHVLTIIGSEKQTADYLLVYMHWGKEKQKHPETFQREWAHKMIDFGADAVIGSHPHVLQGFEFYNGKAIAYSLGNFLFPDYVKGDSAQTGILHLTLTEENISMNFNPYYIKEDLIIPQSDLEKNNVWNELEKISYNITVDNGDIIWMHP